MRRILPALALFLSAAALPAFAEGAEAMTCADYAALDEPGRMEALGAEGGMMSSDDAGGMMASSDAAGAMDNDDGLAAADAACAAHPDMTVGAAMEAMH
jgi:hypothetical protein